MGDGVNLGDERARFIGHCHVEEPGPPALLHLTRLGVETPIRGRRRRVGDRHVERQGELSVGAARSVEGDVGDGEDDFAVGQPLDVDHVLAKHEGEPAVAAAEFEVFVAVGPGPPIVLEPGRQLTRYRLAGGLAYRIVAVRMKLDSLEACSW